MTAYNTRSRHSLEDEFASIIAGNALSYLEQQGIAAYAKGKISAAPGIGPWFPSTLTFQAIIYCEPHNWLQRYLPKRVADISMSWSQRGNNTACRSYDRSAISKEQLEAIADKTARDPAEQSKVFTFFQNERATELRERIAQATGLRGRSYPLVSDVSSARRATS
jgi:hypothetical protein